MFETAGRLSRTGGAAWADSGTASALAAKRTAKTPDFNMIPPRIDVDVTVGDNAWGRAPLPPLSLCAALTWLKPPVGIAHPRHSAAYSQKAMTIVLLSPRIRLMRF